MFWFSQVCGLIVSVAAITSMQLKNIRWILVCQLICNGVGALSYILLDGLSRLEYRGYDSAGICVHGKKGLEIAKAKGRLQVLAEQTENGAAVPGTVGIGHTRWATHGAPSDVNSHPHLSDSGKIAVVHNGIIENYLELKTELKNINF